MQQREILKYGGDEGKTEARMIEAVKITRTHLELMKRKGQCYNLYIKQFQDKIEQKIELLKK